MHLVYTPITILTTIKNLMKKFIKKKKLNENFCIPKLMHSIKRFSKMFFSGLRSYAIVENQLLCFKD